MFTAGAVTKKGQIISEAFNTKKEAEDYLLALAEKEDLKVARIRNLETKEEERIDF